MRGRSGNVPDAGKRKKTEMADYTTCVRLVEGRAEVHTGGGTFTVAAGNDTPGALRCPVELVVAALGS